MLFSIPASSICQIDQKIALPFVLSPPHALRLTIIKSIIAAKKAFINLVIGANFADFCINKYDTIEFFW